ncbi:MAG TPA: DUF4286 family protein [Saprospiraceae bacterium]|nr:DUF4286 family protein [Saprospiraceae bacterium]HMP23843.1 DUF4286 family protein [Saprospiraceae bacterium]
MILYNVTVKIEHAAHAEWLQWMKTVHIPDVMSTGLFLEYRMGRLLGMDEPDGVTYAIQYYLTDGATFEQYQAYYAPRLQAAHTEKFRGRFVAFRTLLEIVDKGAFYTEN